MPAACSHTHPPPPGLVDNRLSPCPGSPNCVSSERNSGRSHIAPLGFTGTPDAAWVDLRNALNRIGGDIRRDDTRYLWATFTTRILRFVDDVQCRLDAANQVIHVRSASRIGYSDFGTNRRRVAALRREFARVQKEHR